MISKRVSPISLIHLLICAAMINLAVGPAVAGSAIVRGKNEHSGVPGTLLNHCNRIVFLGDSITYSGQYIDDIEMFLRRASPGSEFQFLNLGLPSETLSGLSEPGHAGGAFPRPDLHDRLEHLLELIHPDLVIACYGMNDGIYHPFDETKFEAYQRGIKLLRQRVLAAGAKIIHVTPPVFDAVPIRGHTLPAGRAEYRQPFEGYDGVLERYSAWLVEQRKAGWVVIDAHTPLKKYLEQKRLTDPGFALASDGVHMNEQGHWLLAEVLLKGLKAPPMSECVVINPSTGKARGPGVKKPHKEKSNLSFVWQTAPPIPLLSTAIESTGLPAPSERKRHSKDLETMLSPADNEHCLVGRTPKPASFRLYENERFLGALSQEEFAAGVDTRRFADLATTSRGREILNLIHKRNHMLSDSWLTTVGHKRPGMEHGLPLNEALSQAEDLKHKIDELLLPVELHFKVETLEK